MPLLVLAGSRLSARALGAVAAVALTASSVVALTPRAADANLCLLVPELRDVTVSQGIGDAAGVRGYETLTRGKTTVVKAYLSKPECATTQDRVKVTSASLQVSFDGLSADPLPTPITGPVFPELLNYAAAPALASASDPVFTVPGSLLTGGRLDQRVEATFTMTVKYEATSSLGVPSTGSVTLRPPGALSGPTTTATFEKASNAPRLLVAVMGDPTKGFAHNWPPRTQSDTANGAEDVLLRALQAASRIGPFKDGVTREIAGVLGVRYTVAPTVLDVRSAIGTDGKFCGTSSNFRALREQLSQFLNSWQAANSSTVVDKVVGVVWGPNSHGPASRTDCADGYAAIGGNQSWTRLTPDTASQPSNAGNLIVMEAVGHSFGSVPQDRDLDGDAYHSVPSAAAGSRGFNTSTGDPISGALSPLKYALSGWNDYTTLLRREDWKYTLCRLTPGSQELCPVAQVDLMSNTTPIGAPAGLASSVYTLAGTTDGTAAGTRIDTYLAPDADVSDPAPASSFRLVQRGVEGDAEPILATTRFPVDFRTSEHHVADGAHPHQNPTSPQGTLEVRFAAVPGAQVFEVYNGDPATTAPIYRRKRDGAPIAVASAVTPGLSGYVNQTAGTTTGATQPALSPDGGLLAYATPGGSTAVKDLVTGAVSVAVSGAAPAWVDEDTLVLARDGSLVLREVTRGAPPAFGPERTIYDSSRQVELFFSPAGRPTADPAGTHLVTAIGGDLWRIDLHQALLSPSGVVCRVAAGSLTGCARLTSGPEDDSDPSYETPTRLLLVRDGAVRAFDVVAGAVQSGTALAAAGQPSASSPLVAYTGDGGGLGLADAATLTVTAPALTSGADSWPSLVDQDVAFARTTAGRTDVLTGRLQSNTLTFSASDAVAGRLRATVYATCEGINHPIFVAVPPAAVDANVGTWSLEWDAAGASCTEPQLYAMVNDGIDSVRIDLGAAFGPAAPLTGSVGAIYSPAPGSTALQYDPEHLMGDVPGVPDGELSWHVSGPGVDTTLSFVRGTPTAVLPPAGGWTPGASYAVSLLRGGSVLARGGFSAAADEDHDNIPGVVEQRCFGVDADRDPTNASGDPDADGHASVDDADPCVSALNVTVDLDANTLKRTANGNTVTLYLSGSAVDLRTVPTASIAVTQIGTHDADLRAVGVQSVTATSAVVKVSRQQLQSFVERLGMTGYVRVVLTGTGSAGSFRGFDPTDPTFS